MSGIAIRPGRLTDIPFVMETERIPGFGEFVGCWDDEMHRSELAKSGSAYVIGESNGAPVAFAILRDLDDPYGNVLLKRIAVARPGNGFGTAFLRLVTGMVFEREPSHRLWLDVIEHNERAQHVYRSVGFREDGILREAYLTPDGKRVSQKLMSILRPEWSRAQDGRVGTQ